MRQVCILLVDEDVKVPLEKVVRVQLIPSNNILVTVFCLSGVLALAGKSSRGSVALSDHSRGEEVDSHYDQGKMVLAITTPVLVLWLSPKLTSGR